MMLVSAMVALLAVGFQAPDPDSDAGAAPWETVVSQEGQFVVDMPSKPTASSSKTETGPGGRIKVIEVQCDTPSVLYIVDKITLPTGVVRGAEEPQLDAFRDYFRTRFNGKVLSEKKVRFEGRPGRDFTIRAQPVPGGGVATIRAREYFVDRSIYALLAVSPDNRELPTDVGRFFGSFALGTTRTKKVGPRPEAKGKELAGWGELIDPDGDCKVRPEGKALTLEVPGTLHDLNADIDKYNAPRILREVDGDFSLTVKVVGDFKPGANSNNPKSVPYNGAGLFVWRDSENFIRLERGAIVRKGKPGTFATFEEREGGTRGAVHNGPLAPGTAYLRLERRGSRIFGFTSKDGKTWTSLKPIDTVWPTDLKVGLDAINSSDAPFLVRFEEFSFKTRAASRPSARR